MFSIGALEWPAFAYSTKDIMHHATGRLEVPRKLKQKHQTSALGFPLRLMTRLKLQSF